MISISWTSPNVLLSCLAGLICLAGPSGCVSKPSTTGARFVVATSQTGFYKYGPAQTFGPDFTLPKDTKVTMLQNSWGYARVMTDDGTTGYVASEDLDPAPPEPPKPPGSSSGVPIPSSTAQKTKRSNVRSVPGVPLFDVSDLPFPDASEAPKPAPGFRF